LAATDARSCRLAERKLPKAAGLTLVDIADDVQAGALAAAHAGRPGALIAVPARVHAEPKASARARRPLAAVAVALLFMRITQISRFSADLYICNAAGLLPLPKNKH